MVTKVKQDDQLEGHALQVIETALAYLELGLTPVPLCKPNPSGKGCVHHGPDCPSTGKRPLVKWKTPRDHNGAILEPLVDKAPWPSELRGWANRFGIFNVGIIVPEGVVVIDIDPRNGGDETAQALGLIEIETPTALTGGGGSHLWFKHDGYLPPLLGPGVDVKGPGTLVVMPPSVHLSGKKYEWEIGYEL